MYCIPPIHKLTCSSKSENLGLAKTVQQVFNNVNMVDLLKGVLATVQDGIFIVKPAENGDFLVTDVNRAMTKFLGRDMSGMFVSEALEERAARWFRKQFLHVIRTGSDVMLRTDAGMMGSAGQFIQVKLMPIMGEDRVQLIVGSVHVMTESSRLKDNARRHRDRYATALEYAPYGVCFVGADGKPSMVNRALTRWLNQPMNTLMRSNVADFVHPDEREVFNQALRQVFKTGRVYRGMDIRLMSDHADDIWTSLNISRMQDAMGGSDSVILQFVDITRRKENEERLSRLARRDHLTGLANRMVFEEELDKTLKNAKRYKRSGAILYIDLDDFKQINDVFGHNAGDAVLKEVARTLGVHTRETDVISRLGGDEFAVILQEVSEKGARQKADAVRTAINSACITHENKQIAIRGSVGLQTFSGVEDIDRHNLLDAADRQMYRVKHAAKADVPVNL